MNALWINRLCSYKRLPLSVESAKRLVEIKTERQDALLKKYKKKLSTNDILAAANIQAVLLSEARAAKLYWREFRLLLPSFLGFHGRKPRAADITNRLLDIGYHHLTNVVRKILDRNAVPSVMGILHVAHKTDSAPLAYDLVELFRADIVDAEVLRFLRLKKKVFINLDQRELAHFLHEVNERLERKYYLKDFKMCHPYTYYMELQILKFISAVNHKTVFDPLHLPARHDSRCSLTPTETMLSLR